MAKMKISILSFAFQQLNAIFLTTKQQYKAIILRQLCTQDLFIIDEIIKFDWQPKLQNTFINTDVVNKNKQKCN